MVTNPIICLGIGEYGELRCKRQLVNQLGNLYGHCTFEREDRSGAKAWGSDKVQ